MIILILAGSVLAFHNLDAKSLRGDELIANRVGLMSLSDIWQDILTRGRNVSWHWFLIHFFSSPDIPFLPRFPSALFMLLSLPLIYQAGARLGNKQVGLLATLLLALSPFNLYYGQDARMYSGLVVVSLLVLLAGWNAVDKPHWKPWLLLMGAAVVCILTHVYAILPLATTLLWIALVALGQWRRAKRSGASTATATLNLRRLMLVSVAAVGTFGLSAATISRNTMGGQDSIVQTVLRAPQQFLNNLLNEDASEIPTAYEDQPPTPDAANRYVLVLDSVVARLADFSMGTGLALILFSILWAIGLFWLLRTRPRALVLSVVWVALPLSTLTIVYVLLLKEKEVPARYLIYILPVLIIVAAHGLVGLTSVLTRKWGRLHNYQSANLPFAIPVALILISPIGVRALTIYYSEPQVKDFKAACLFLTQVYQPGDAVIISNKQIELDAYSFYCANLPPATAFTTLPQMQSALKGSTRAWVYRSSSSASDAADAWLSSNGYRVQFMRVSVDLVLNGGPTPLTASERLQLLATAARFASTTKSIVLPLARTYMQFGQYEDARNLLEHYVNLFPEEAAIRVQLGAAYEGLGDFTAAEKAYRQASRDDPAGALALATLTAAQGQLDEAITLVQKLLAENDRFTAGYITLAQLQQAQGDLAGAETSLAKAAELEPDNVQVWLNWAALAQTQGDGARAEQFLRQAIAVAPTQPAGYVQLASLLADQGRQDEALELLNQALLLDPANPNAYFQRGNVFSAIGDLDAALVDYRASLTQSNRLQLTEAAVRRSADILLRLGRAEEALALVEEALQSGPESGSLYVTLATVYLALARDSSTTGQQLLNLTAAERALNEAGKRLSADDVNLLLARAEWAISSNRPQEAINWLQQAVETQPTNVNLWRDLATAQSSAGLYDAAQTSLQQATTLAPERPDLHAALAEVYRLQGNLAARVAELELAVELEPTNSSYQRALGEAYALAGNTTAALAAYQAALTLQPESAATQRELAALYWQSGACEEAIAQLNPVIESEAASASDLLLMGDYYANCEQVEAALATYARAIPLVPVRAHLKLGQLYAAIGDSDAATREFTVVLQTAPKSEFAETARNWFVAQGLPLPATETPEP